MNEGNPNNTHEQQDKHSVLKAKLLSGKITPYEFRNELLEIDQATGDRKGALKNYETLTDPEVAACFLDQGDQDLIDNYYIFLSFTEFHIGQIKVIDGEVDEGIEFFKRSLSHKQAWDEERSSIEGLYTQATIAYLEDDLATLEEVVPKIENDRNREIGENFIKGLKKNGTHSYIDYYYM